MSQTKHRRLRLQAMTKELRNHWMIVATLTALSVVGYVARTNISVAAKLMMPELGITQIQMGQVFSIFLVAYGIFQVPTGVLGDRLGPRRVLVLSALAWAAISFLFGWLPGTIVGVGTASLTTLLVLRVALGAAEASTFPVAARACADWVPSNRRALGNSFVIAGVPVGTAITAPLVAWLMVTLGWRSAFYVSGILALAVALALWLVTRDAPVGSTAAPAGAAPVARDASGDWRSLVRNPNFVLLSISYFFEGYIFFIFVFWLYTYLIDVRGFTLLSGGVMASLPWLLAMGSTPLGGFLADRLAPRRGRLGGARAVVLAAYLLAAVCLAVGARTGDRYVAVVVLSLSVAGLMAAEAGFWSGVMHLGGEATGTAGGILNGMGIIGGVVSTSLVPILVAEFGWLRTLDLGAAASAVSGLFWLAIKDRRG